MFKRVDYTIVMVSDMARSVQFYRDVLGFRLRFSSAAWTEFETDGTTLALHGGARALPERPVPEKPAGTVTIGLHVSNLDATVRMLKQQGAVFLAEPGLREEQGIRFAVVSDPDGLPISLVQTVVP